MKKKIYDYSINAGEQTLKQFKDCYSQKFVVSAALMPDAHFGYVAPIGAVLITKNYIVPSWVGFDIGCGMIAIKLSGQNILEKINNNKNKIYTVVKKAIPMGLGNVNKKHNISKQTQKKFLYLLEKFKKKPYDKSIYQFIKSVGLRDVGTLSDAENKKSRYSLKIIAGEVGFKSLSTFITAFKKETGLTPSKFRDSRS